MFIEKILWRSYEVIGARAVSQLRWKAAIGEPRSRALRNDHVFTMLCNVRSREAAPFKFEVDEMISFRIVLSLALSIMSAIAHSQSPFTLNGLHVDLALADAVAQAEKLGGHCAPGSFNRSQSEGDSIHCQFAACVERDIAGECDKVDMAEVPKVAAQPILTIVLEAPEVGGPLNRIMIIHEGDTDAVAASLLAEFGPTDADGSPTGKPSWSHARRWSWTQGLYRLGLLNAPKMIVLAVDRVQEPAVENSAAVAAPSQVKE